MFGTRLRHLPVPLIASAVLLVLGAGIGAAVDGVTGAIGAAVGVGIVTISYTISVLLIAFADAIKPALVLPVGIGVYVVKFTWIGMVMSVLASHDWQGMKAMGFGVLAGVTCWSAMQIWTVIRNGPHSSRANAGTAISSRAPQE